MSPSVGEGVYVYVFPQLYKLLEGYTSRLILVTSKELDSGWGFTLLIVLYII